MKLENYVLEKSIGKGIISDIYLTSKKDDPKKYATKKISREEVEKSEYMKYLKNSIVVLQYLNHPNIVKLQEVKKSKKNFFIILEYCNGGDLKQTLEKYMEKYGKPFDEKIVQHFMKQIIGAFEYIHEKKIIHRNISLDNILLNFDNEEDKKNFNLLKANIKISGFGFACKISKEGLQYSIVGDTLNMFPIILKKLNSSNKKEKQLGYNEKADIWSIGSICYEMLIGKPVFDAEDMEELVKIVEEGNYTIPSSMSREVASFLNGMLQYESKNRLSAAQLYRHDFLNKDVKDFHSIKLLKNEKEKGILINHKNNYTIWSIFNKNDENLLKSITGNQFIKPIDEKEKMEFENMEKKESNVTMDSSVQLPIKGIPDNPTDTKVSGLTKEEMEQSKGYTFDVSASDLFN